MNLDVPGIGKKGDQTAQQLKSLTLEMLKRTYNLTIWTHVYTERSAEEAVRNGGSGFLIRFPTEKETIPSLFLQVSGPPT